MKDEQPQPQPQPRALLVMGVSGSGKSTVGQYLAERLGAPFIDADDLHPTANKEKMRRSIPLSDEDRWPWLDAVAQATAAQLAAGRSTVVACSALRRSYRDALRATVPGLVLIFLDGDREFIRNRMAGRDHEFMPDDLLDSQFAALEPPEADEAVIRIPLERISDALLDELVLTPLSGQAG